MKEEEQSAMRTHVFVAGILELQLVNHIVGHLRLAITTHKKRTESRIPEADLEAKLQCAAARMFGLSSRDV